MRIENTIQPILTYDNKNKISGDGTGFAQLFKEAISKVDQVQKEADLITEKFAMGEIENIHQVTIATEEAKIALELTMAVRNKVVEAYKEIMRMQF